jgi:protein-tyrosine phosphatase
VIDLHSHVLPGIDDGPETVEGSMAMLRVAVASGIETILATPHVSGHYRNDSAGIARAAASLTDELARLEPRIELLLGAEVAVTRVAEIEPEELSALRLGDGPWLLIEPPFATVVHGLRASIEQVHAEGHRVLLAHPERCPAFQRDPALLESLVDGGVLTSLTAGSLVGRFGGEAKRFALDLLEAGLAHDVASDAHDVEKRAPSIGEELRASGFGELEDWLTRDVPAAILAGGEIPRRPAVASTRTSGRRSWFRRRR